MHPAACPATARPSPAAPASRPGPATPHRPLVRRPRPASSLPPPSGQPARKTEDNMNKRTRTMKSIFQPQSVDSIVIETCPSPRVPAQLKPGDIESDPGKRIPIDNLDPDIRDLARREYISKGPCQPTDHKYERKWVGKGFRSFHDSWYKNHRGWLEYSIDKNGAFCFYCFLFKQPRAENFGVQAFTKNGLKNWKDGPKILDEHVCKHDSAHNKARQHYEAFKNQRQNLPHVFDRGTQKDEEEYKARLLIILGVIKFLLLQGLAFRGHDESITSKNKGNFKELFGWLIEKDRDARKLIGDAGAKHKQTSPEIQLDLCKACAEETTKAIVDEIGDGTFSLLVDECRDTSIKEQNGYVFEVPWD